MKKLLDSKKVTKVLEGQGRGIFMGVTRLVPLGPFYYIQTNFLYLFAHDCRGATKKFWSFEAILFVQCHLTQINALEIKKKNQD